MESMYVLAPVPNLKADVDWDTMGPVYRDRLLLFLEAEFGLENFRNELAVTEMFTPADFRDQRNNFLGSAWGLEPKLTQSASFRPGNRSSDVEGLYLVGASTHPGAGVPGVMLSAEATARAIIEDEPALINRLSKQLA
jgi:phytoene desaturase